MLLNSWPAEAALFDGDIMAGPVPTLFGADPDASLTSIMAEPRKAHWDLMKINRLLFMPENLKWRRPLRSPQEQVGRQQCCGAGAGIFSWNRSR